MIRIGRYDAFDKWEIVCRSWRGEAAEAIVDKWGSPALPIWQELALAGGVYACITYIEARLSSVAQKVDCVINREIAQLAGRLGNGGLKDLVGKLGPTIAGGEFRAPFDEGLSPQLVERLREVFRTGAIKLLQWSDMRGEVPSIEIMRTRYNDFPVNAIKHRRNVLSLFGALNYGRSDVIHIHDICPEHVTLVDIDAGCLDDMRLIYPKEWTFVCADFREFLNKHAAERRHTYDLIVADTYFKFARDVAWELLPTIMGMCSDTFITSYFKELFDELGVALDDLVGLSRAVAARTGVTVTFTEIMPRNSAVFWAVMRKK